MRLRVDCSRAAAKPQAETSELTTRETRGESLQKPVRRSSLSILQPAPSPLCQGSSSFSRSQDWGKRSRLSLDWAQSVAAPEGCGAPVGARAFHKLSRADGAMIPALHNGFKARMVKRLVGPERISAAALAREVGVSQPTLSRWKQQARTLPAMSDSKDKPEKKAKSPRQWSAAEKLRAVVEAAELSGEQLGEFLPSNGFIKLEDAGARQSKVCELLDLDPGTVRSWIKQGVGDDGRAGPKRSPRNKISIEERAEILGIAKSPECRDLSPKQIGPLLADQGGYVASESTIKRILREEKLLTHRSASKPAKKTLLGVCPTGS